MFPNENKKKNIYQNMICQKLVHSFTHMFIQLFHFISCHFIFFFLRSHSHRHNQSRNHVHGTKKKNNLHFAQFSEEFSKVFLYFAAVLL